ncbi:aromatic-ring hydroxylase C-terminal domain-containing protein [Fodinicola feengrottensis]|uniref:aromatic-ring hydroxylase C-terminal domain-containing protein n=1 Tax=Fodinicola feengrottensis TaxID=435914 RepID=UPI0036F28D92
METARPLLLDFTSGGAAIPAGWSDRVEHVLVSAADTVWNLPGAGKIPAPVGVLVRPDGYVAWVATDSSDLDSLRAALTTWFGPAS